MLGRALISPPRPPLDQGHAPGLLVHCGLGRVGGVLTARRYHADGMWARKLYVFKAQVCPDESQ